MRRWWCMECQVTVGLNKHGRCEKCDSEAVDPMRTKAELRRQLSTTCKNGGSSKV